VPTRHNLDVDSHELLGDVVLHGCLQHNEQQRDAPQNSLKFDQVLTSHPSTEKKCSGNTGS
tara:strand:- start:25 stop:207 length:183 start_codon:yes stop_codon:yes gene_type:complete